MTMTAAITYIVNMINFTHFISGCTYSEYVIIINFVGFYQLILILGYYFWRRNLRVSYSAASSEVKGSQIY